MPQAATTPPPLTPVEQIGKEALAFWESVADLLVAYVADLAGSTGPGAIVAANGKLIADSMAICSSAAGAMLRQQGLTAPLLSDA